MNESVREKQPNREKLKIFISLLIATVLVAATVIAFLRLYRIKIDDMLYSERLNQMKEVTTQLFSGLEDVIRNQWRMVEEQKRSLQNDNPKTWDDLLNYMQKQSFQSDFESVRCNIVAVDENGSYYTQSGKKGLLQEREYILDEPERINFVSNSMTTGESRMVFLEKLENPMLIKDGDRTFTICYYGISQNMEELNPYFECEAYSGNSRVYVLDNDGLKLFSSSSSSSSSRDLLKGYNVLTTLGNMSYLHGSSFEDTMKEFEENNISYSNTLLDDTELYYVIYRMQNSAWTLVFLVPSEFVAMSTVDLVNLTMRWVVMFAIILIVTSIVLITWMMRKQQKAELNKERNTNRQLEELNAKLESASKAKSDFLSNMSHDIRTPMNAIVGITNLMVHDKRDPEKMDAYIRKIQYSSQHLLSLINDVLDMSKIESSAVSLNKEPIRISDQFGQIESIVRPQINERKQTFVIRTKEVRHEFLFGDAVRLRQIFINLLSNAIKYTPNGGKVILELAEQTCDTPGYAKYCISVMDNGYGMTKEFSEHIFEPFTRAENSTTNRVQGTGLGMSITKSIVDLMGGTISVQSEPNRGTKFEVVIPLEIDKNASLQVPFHNIMIISDDADFIANAKAAFSDRDVILHIAESESEADKVLDAEELDVILLGSHLQGRRLEDNVDRLREHTKSALLFYCCNFEEQDQLEGITDKGGVDGMLARPLFVSNIVKAFERAQSGNRSEEDDSDVVLHGKRFLCAEDNALNAEILEAVLDMNGATCVIYPNGQEIVDAFMNVKENEFDAILMDVQMPVMNGMDATRAIRKGENPLGETIPIIAMTANAFSEDVQNCLNAGMDAHVSKPLDVSVLSRTLQGLLFSPRRKSKK